MSWKGDEWAWSLRGVSLKAKITALAIGDFHNLRDNEAVPRIDELADTCEISRASVKRAIAELVATKRLVVEHRKRPDGSSTSNGYRLLCKCGQDWAAHWDSARQRVSCESLVPTKTESEYAGSMHEGGAQSEPGGGAQVEPPDGSPVNRGGVHSSDPPILKPGRSTQEKNTSTLEKTTQNEQSLLRLINAVAKRHFRWEPDSQHRRWLQTILRRSPDLEQCELVLRHRYRVWSDSRSSHMLAHFTPDTLARHWDKYRDEALAAADAATRQRARQQSWRKQIVEPDEPVGDAENFAEAIREECGALAKRMRRAAG